MNLASHDTVQNELTHVDDDPGNDPPEKDATPIDLSHHGLHRSE